MIGIEIIKYSLKNLWHRKTRSFLTVLSILVGITTIFIFISFGLGLFDYVGSLTSSSSVDKVLIQPKGGGMPGLDTTFALSDEELEIIRKTPGVIEASGSSFKIVEVKQDKHIKYTFLISYDPDTPIIMDIFNVDIEEGRGLKSSDVNKVVLGYNYLHKNKIFPKAYTIGDKIEINRKEFKIIGFLGEIGNPQDDSQIYISENFFDELYPEDSETSGWVVARVEVKDLDKIVERIEKNLRKNRNLEEGKEDFFVQSFDEMIEAYSSALNIIIGFVILIAFISVIVSAINTANTMVTSVLERIKEIGVMKAIGARNSEVFKIFLFESSFLGFIAGILGVLLGWIITYSGGVILNALGWGFLSPSSPISLFIGCILFATVTGAISGALPAYQASKTNVVDALRYE